MEELFTLLLSHCMVGLQFRSGSDYGKTLLNIKRDKMQVFNLGVHSCWLLLKFKCLRFISPEINGHGFVNLMPTLYVVGDCLDPCVT